MRGGAASRRVVRTVLLAGEGDSEVLFLQHLKRIYVQRGSGVVVTIKNARGKGAGHVVDFADRQPRNAAYEVKVVLLEGRVTAQLKHLFLTRFGAVASEASVYERHFSHRQLDVFRHRVALLEGLIHLLINAKFQVIA
jgi:hypothetical protein